MPFVSVWAMSNPHVKTATFAFFTFFTMPIHGGSDTRDIGLIVERTLRLPPEDHTPNDRATAKASTHDLHHAHIVDIEVLGIGRHHS